MFENKCSVWNYMEKCGIITLTIILGVTLMKKTYEVYYHKNLDFDDEVSTKITVDEVGECPVCHMATSPTFLNGYLIGSKENRIPLTAYLILYCPGCEHIYIATYLFTNGTSHSILIDAHPKYSVKKSFSSNIIELSPEFVNIYSQALEAESNNNTKGLSGLGYRKAIEFLIKDYLIKLKHQDKDTIINMDLGNCIKKLDSDLQDIALASTWLGNDEVHYFRKNEGYSSNDLKEFIDCLVTDIEREYVRKKAKKLVNK